MVKSKVDCQEKEFAAMFECKCYSNGMCMESNLPIEDRACCQYEFSDPVIKILPKVNKIKMLPKQAATFMQPTAEGDRYVEVVSVKNMWKCMTCGFVWSTRRDAKECEHVGHYQRIYGGHINNGRRVGGYQITFKAVRKEPI